MAFISNVLEYVVLVSARQETQPISVPARYTQDTLGRVLYVGKSSSAQYDIALWFMLTLALSGLRIWASHRSGMDMLEGYETRSKKWPLMD